MKEYELTVLIHPDLETDLETPLAKVRSLVTTHGGNIIKEDVWGKKKLAYRIKKEDFAVYVYFDVKLPADALLKISNTLNITDEVLRYLLVTVDEKGRAALEEAKANASENDVKEEEQTMAKGFNKVILMGNLTRDPETRSTSGGQSVTNFSLAVSRSWKGADGTKQDQVSYINCVAWAKTGEVIAQYLSKGSPVLVSGRLEQRTWDDKDSGQKRSAVDVIVEDFNFVGGGRSDDGDFEQGGGSSQSKKSGDVVIEDVDDKPIDLSEIPF